jgi:virginiamycin B lyase
MGITGGPDGNLWFTEGNLSRIGRITPTGTITEFSVPGDVSKSITRGSDGNLWFAGSTRIWRITPTGTILDFAAPEFAADEITTGPDGNLWFTEQFGNQIGRMTLDGTLTEFSLPAPYSWPEGITAGSDGNVWFTEPNPNRIGRMTPAGTLTEFVLPGVPHEPRGITAGPDGNVWFTDSLSAEIGRMTPDGILTEFPLPRFDSTPRNITTGPDSKLWFTDPDHNLIGQMTLDGMVTEFSLPMSYSGPLGITAGPDGNVWFTETSGRIGRLSGFMLSPTPTPRPCTIMFSDVPVESWAYGYIRYLVCHGLASGYSDGTFRPDAAVTRGQLANMAVLAAGVALYVPPGAPHFSDVPPAHPFYPYVEAARAAGLISGYSDGTFQPSAPVTRAQLAKIIVGATGFPLLDPATPTFGDVPVADWAYGYIETAVAHGIVGGYDCGGVGEPCPGRYYRPGTESTRAQVAKLLYQAFVVPARK